LNLLSSTKPRKEGERDLIVRDLTSPESSGFGPLQKEKVDVDRGERYLNRELTTPGSIEDDPTSSTVVPILNPFANILEKSKHKVKVQFGSYEINRLDSGNLESSIVWSVQSSYPERFKQKFPAMGTEQSIVFFRELVTMAALSEMVDVKYEQGGNLNLDDLLITMTLEVMQLESMPKSIGDSLRKYEDQFSEQYSSNLVKFLETNFCGTDLLEFWRKTVKDETLRENNFFQLSSNLLEIGIVVWNPDETPGDYIISCCFGGEFKDTIHIISHYNSLEVITTALTTR
jgi:hypothetical protein